MMWTLLLAIAPFLASSPQQLSAEPAQAVAGVQTPGIHTPEAGGDAVDWVAFGEAMQTNTGGKKKLQRPLMVDFYTDWCGWCKRQDATTFRDPRVVAYLNQHFHAVQFDAEGSAPVEFKGETLTRQGKTHSLALQLASNRGRIGYPTIVLLSPEGETWAVLQGYQTAEKLLPQLVYYAEGYHEDLDFATFSGIYTMPEAP